MRMSQSSTKIDFGSIGSPPWKPLTPRVSFTCLSRAGISIPLLFFMAPVISLTATIIPPFSLISWAAHEPTLPKPCKESKNLQSLYSSHLVATVLEDLCPCTVYLNHKPLSRDSFSMLIEKGLGRKEDSSSCSCISSQGSTKILCS